MLINRKGERQAARGAAGSPPWAGASPSATSAVYRRSTHAALPHSWGRTEKPKAQIDATLAGRVPQGKLINLLDRFDSPWSFPGFHANRWENRRRPAGRSSRPLPIPRCEQVPRPDCGPLLAQFGDNLPGKTRGRLGATTPWTTRYPRPAASPLAKNAILFLWRVASMQAEALEVVDTWGHDPGAPSITALARFRPWPICAPGRSKAALAAAGSP